MEGRCIAKPSAALCGIPAASTPATISIAMLRSFTMASKPRITFVHCSGQNGNRRLSQYTGDWMPDLKVTGSCGRKPTPSIAISASAISRLHCS